MKAAEIFNECHARYRGLHGGLDDSLGQVRALDLDSPSTGYQASGTLTRLRTCGGFRAHWPPCAQAARVEAAFESI